MFLPEPKPDASIVARVLGVTSRRRPTRHARRHATRPDRSTFSREQVRESRADGDGAPVSLGLQPPTASCPKRPSWAPSSERPNTWSDSAKAFFSRRSTQPATRSIFSRDMRKAAARDRTSCETVRSFAAAPRSSSARSQAGRRTCRVSITSDRCCRSVLMRVTVWHQERTRNAPSHAVHRLRTTALLGLQLSPGEANRV